MTHDKRCTNRRDTRVHDLLLKRREDRQPTGGCLPSWYGPCAAHISSHTLRTWLKALTLLGRKGKPHTANDKASSIQRRRDIEPIYKRMGH
jgi:hypothetical protein